MSFAQIGNSGFRPKNYRYLGRILLIFEASILEIRKHRKSQMYPKIVKKRTKPQQETTFVKQQKTVQVVSIAKRRRKTEQFI